MRARLISLFTILVLTGIGFIGIVAQEGAFTSPDAVTQKFAIGETRFLPADQKKAFTESRSFSPKSEAEGIDWLASHDGPGQTFEQFLSARRNLVQPPRTKLYVQPIGEFSDKEKAVLEQVKAFAKIFFQMEVEMKPTLDPAKNQITSRKNPGSGNTQFLSTDILTLLRDELPADGYSILAITMIDLYPEESGNFVFGQASIQERVGVFSFARYGEAVDPKYLQRCLKVFTHETGHMFGVRHCIHYQCLMNGSNSLPETDVTPLRLCPVCLRKLHSAKSFGIKERYEQMRAFFKKHHLDDDAKWVAGRVSEVAE